MAERAAPTGVKPAPPTPVRRSFFARAGALMLGGIVVVFPLLSGLVVFFDPLRRKSAEGKWYRVGTLESLKAGVPERVAIVDNRRDAWTEHGSDPIGAVFLVAAPGKTSVTAFNTTCPHAGCSVAYDSADHRFLCPCHTSSFDLAGKAISPVPPRDMDQLACEIRNHHEIWVKYQDYLTGSHEKIPKA